MAERTYMLCPHIEESSMIWNSLAKENTLSPICWLSFVSHSDVQHNMYDEAFKVNSFLLETIDSSNISMLNPRFEFSTNIIRLLRDISLYRVVPVESRLYCRYLVDTII